MFKKGEWYKEPRKKLRHRLNQLSAGKDMTDEHLRRMVEVEYGLILMERLNLLDEPIITVPSLLALHQLPALSDLKDDEWRLIAYARYRIPNYISNQRWQDDLREYTKLPAEAQLYHVLSERPIEEQLLRDVIYDTEYTNHLEIYNQISEKRPPYNVSSIKLAKPEKAYHFYLTARNGKWRQAVSVELPTTYQGNLPSWTHDIKKVDDEKQVDAYIKHQQKPQRPPITISWETLVEEAKIMHQRKPQDQWEKRIHDIHLRDNELHINQQMHLVGMVGAGKSTLVKIVSHHLVRTTDATIVIIVPTTIDGFKFANEINQLLGCDWDSPSAVVYYGWSNRENHIQTFLDEYGDDFENFGHRWVSTSCGLMPLISHDIIAQMPSAPRAGSEPCTILSETPLQSQTDADEEFKRPSRDITCPLFANCPSHQKLRDLSQARIIVTTAGGLQSRLPVFFDPRGLSLSDYIYEWADVVFVDEADEVQSFQDDQFVNAVPLWNLPRALFSSADASVSESLRYDELTELQEEWGFSLRDGAKYVLPILRMLHKQGNTQLLEWIGRSYFSAYRSFQMVARRLIGLPDWTSISEINQDKQLKVQYEYLSTIFSMFTARDYTKIPDPDYDDLRHYGDASQVRYAIKLRDILWRATTNIPRELEGDLLKLVEHILAVIKVDLKESLEKLNQRTKEDAKVPHMKEEVLESPQSLTHKLMFCLLVAGLDREIRALVYNADSQPDQVATVLDVRDFNPNFKSAHAALPIAYTGSIFGTYYMPEDRAPEQNKGERGKNEALSRLEFINPGRELLLGFHNLYRLFDIYGPHVVFLSGTSFLPDSTRWHIRIPVGGILEANKQWKDTILDHSEYHFSPAFDGQRNPINVSGRGNSDHDNRSKRVALELIAQYWGKHNTLENQLEDLRRRGKQDHFWSGRDRILIFVNSYEQASTLCQAIQRYTKLGHDLVTYLTPTEDEYGGIARASIENIAKTNFHVLVAPLSAIGRGHNILTEDTKQAAFGAVYFTVRPINPPGDVRGIAAEINAKGAEWLSRKNLHSTILREKQIHQQELALRRLALEQWRRGEQRTYYKRLQDDERRDLGATTFGRFVQASGRLVRGGVPMLVYFIDAAWAPESAKRLQDKGYRKYDTPQTSLLVEMIERLKSYTAERDSVGYILYQPFMGLLDTKCLFYYKGEKNNE